jgi:fatty acid desaturase/RNA polymerase-interacting CarD/CdnL/TRCF family regulator
MIGHEAGHGSFAASTRHNEIVLHLVFPLFGGLGAQHWKHKHNHLHHGSPNVVGRDPDMNVWPMALSSEEHAASSRFRRWFQRTLQGYLFWPLTLLLAFAMRVESWRHVVGRVRAGRLDRALVLDAGCMVAHYALWLALPMVWFGAWPVLLVYAGLWGTSGLLLALIFAPAHMGLPVRGCEQRGGWRHQLETTRNFTMPRWLSWFFVGLDFQVEHHLFPRIPHQNLEKASRTVAPWCARVGAPYQRVHYASSLRQVTHHVRRSWQTAPEVVVSSSPPEKLETLTVGSRVFYPGHGVASVAAIEKRAFGGAMQVYYVLALASDRAATVLLPIDKVGQAGVRPLVSAHKARALMRAVAEAPAAAEFKSDAASRKHRATGYSDALRSGSADRYTEALRELLARFRAGKLSPSEQQTLNQALAMFVGEVSAALDRTLDDVRAELRTSGELPAAGW